MGLLEELRKMYRGAVVDLAKVGSPVALWHFVWNGILNEWMKWFGHSDRLWNFMYSNLNYVKKMEDPSQQQRYLELGDLMKKVARPNPAVLDVGCGIANALQIWREHIKSYEGIDIAKAAIEAARSAFLPDGSVHPFKFEATSFQDYVSETTFDVIVFNESLYYVKSVDGALDMALKAWRLLPRGGVLLISMSETHHAQKIWDALDQSLLQEPEIQRMSQRAVAKEGNTWTVTAYVKKAAK
uniref:Methyltransferase domain-containing protein n=1 Tax=Zooxanthella nutricula TaxID=1333877 RepID=A0A7S2P7K5_9DINO